jgi:hypothetical protein
VGVSEATSILKKIDPLRSIKYYSSRGGNNTVYWVRVPGYFCQFFLEPPKARLETGGPERMRGEVLSVTFEKEDRARVVHAVLSSSTYYQFYCAYSDSRHINPSDVLDFPVALDKLAPGSVAQLVSLSRQLEQILRDNTMQWRKSGLLIDSVDSKAAKPIIDEIDRVLARHYGFTDEELDFITNYDIKYRMGDELAATDENE